LGLIYPGTINIPHKCHEEKEEVPVMNDKEKSVIRGRFLSRLVAWL